MNEPKLGEELISHLPSRLGDPRLLPEDSARFLHMLSRVFDLTRCISELGRCQNRFLAGLETASKIWSCRQTLPCCQRETGTNPGFSEDEEKTMKCCLPVPA